MTRVIGGKTKIYGILGYPVEHTFSPLMQNIAFSTMKIDACYVAFPVSSGNLKQAIGGIRALGISGINVTVPHKSSVIPFLDNVTPLAGKIGAVNTISNVDGKLTGTNTDISGFIRSLGALKFKPKKKKVALLGAGGSARAILAGLADCGVSSISIYNRTSERAESLVAEFGPLFPGTEIVSTSIETIQNSNFDLLVNTTTVGMEKNSSPINLSDCKKIDHVIDIIYSPIKTKLIFQAEDLNIPCLNGSLMLIYQGCDAFTFWTGESAPENTMREQLFKILE